MGITEANVLAVMDSAAHTASSVGEKRPPVVDADPGALLGRVCQCCGSSRVVPSLLVRCRGCGKAVGLCCRDRKARLRCRSCAEREAQEGDPGSRDKLVKTFAALDRGWDRRPDRGRPWFSS